MEEPPSLPAQSEEPQGPPMSLPARLMNVIATPGEVFDEVRSAPVATANWLVPALLFIVVGWISAVVIYSDPALKQQWTEMIETPMRLQMEKMMPKEKVDEAVQKAMRVVRIWTTIVSYAGPVVAAFFTPFCWGFILWLGGKVLKGNFEYMKAVEIAGLANVIGMLEVIIRTLLILVMGNILAAPSLALAVKGFNPQDPAHAALALVNVMTIWFLAVGSIGLARAANVSFAKAAAWVFGIWLAYSGVFFALGQAGRLLTKHAPGS